MNNFDMPPKGAVQDHFLAGLAANYLDVAVYLTSGIRLEGRIVGVDRHVILLRRQTTIPVYKHAIASVVPLQERKPAGLDVDRDAATRSTLRTRLNRVI
jgi:RNA chaperone Hfq